MFPFDFAIAGVVFPTALIPVAFFVANRDSRLMSLANPYQCAPKTMDIVFRDGARGGGDSMR